MKATIVPTESQSTPAVEAMVVDRQPDKNSVSRIGVLALRHENDMCEMSTLPHQGCTNSLESSKRISGNLASRQNPYPCGSNEWENDCSYSVSVMLNLPRSTASSIAGRLSPNCPILLCQSFIIVTSDRSFVRAPMLSFSRYVMISKVQKADNTANTAYL